MNWEDIGKKLVEILEPVYKPESEQKLLKSIISILYHQSMDIDDAEKVLIGIYDNLPAHSVRRSDVFRLLDSIFAGEVKANTGLASLEKTISVDYSNTVATKAVKKIKKLIVPERNLSNTYATSNNSWIEIDTFNNKVNYKSISAVKNEQIENTIPVLLCRPYKITIHEDPLYEGKREFTITWKTVNGTFFTTRQVSLSDIKSQLSESGYVMQSKYADSAIVGSIQIFQDNGIAEQKNEIEAAGFYYSKEEHRLITVDYELKPLNKNKIKEALEVIEDLGTFFVGNEEKLATTLKHGLQVPFGFAKKQMGLPLEYLIPYIFHFGKSGSGKTTIARIALWFYVKPSVDVNDIGGTEFDTVARIGEQLRKFTFGTLINEPETSLNKKSCAATLKTTTERTNSRQRIRGFRMEHILALSTLSFASNVPLPSHEGLPRRFVQILYNYGEKKTVEQKEKFMNHFKVNNPDECEFNKLQELGNFTANLINDDVDLLKKDWKSLGNYIIDKAYEFCGMQTPYWLLAYTESITDDDLELEEVEDIRMFFASEINKQSGQIKLYSADDGRAISQEVFYTDDAKTSDDFEDKVWNVINEGLIPYMITHQTKEGVREVCFTSGMKKVLNDNGINCYSVSSTAEMLGWKYAPTSIQGKTYKCMKVKFRKFLRFLYPSMESYDEN